MRVLYISYEPPCFPGGDGGQTRQYNILKVLSQRHEIDLFMPPMSQDKKDVAGTVSASLTTPPALLIKLMNIPFSRIDRGYPFFTQQFESVGQALLLLLRIALMKKKYALIHIEHTNIAHWLSGISPRVPRVLVAHNVKTIMWQRYCMLAFGAEKQRLEKEAIRFRAYEAKYLAEYTRLIAVSEVDRSHLERITANRVPVDVVDNGVDINFFSPWDTKQSSSIVFTGSMGHPPNHYGIIDFVSNTWPLVKAEFNDIKLAIVGKNPSSDILFLGTLDGVKVTGFVPDTRPYLADAAIVIAPLHSGSGTRLKILEAMAMGKAVVSTSIGAEGIQYTDGYNIIIADTSHDFASAIGALLRDPIRRQEVGMRGRELVVNRYSWISLAEKQELSWKLCVDSR